MPRNAKAFEVGTDDHGLNVGQPGAYYFLNRHPNGGPIVPKVGIVHGCPCGCGGRSIIFFAGLGAGRQEWSVEGEWPKVTLHPSIGIKYDANGVAPADGSYHWHGFLRDGNFIEC